MKNKTLLSLKQPDIYVLILALLVVSAIIGITRSTNKNIDSLLQSNQATSKSYFLKDKVNTLLSDVLLMETTQTNNTFSETNYYEKGALSIAKVEADLKQLEPLVPEQFEMQFRQLSFFVQRRIKFSWLVLNAYHNGRSNETTSLLNTGIGKSIRDSVYKYAGLLEVGFARGVQSNLTINDQKSRKLQPIITSLSVISFIAILALSGLIIYRIRHKNRLIYNLEEAYAREQETMQELEKARLEAESILHVKESFIANMSHEIRTPITAVLGFSNLLHKTDLTDEQKKFLGYIQTSGSSLLSIVNDILDLSKLEAGMVHIEKLPFRLRDLINDVVAMFQVTSLEKGLHLSVHIDKDCPDNIIGDALRLKQVLTNLIANAVKFTHVGGIAVMVRAIREENGVITVRFNISDSGIGMSKEQLANLFQRFEQGENEITRKYGGTGLGLAISKNLIELLGGALQVESNLGEGTIFHMDIPFERSSITLPVATEPVAEINFKRGRVLIVDDNQVNRMLVEYMLKEWQISFESAGNGKEAIELLKHETFDLILMDIQMPEMDGYTASRIIKTELSLDTPIVAMTANVLPGEEGRCRAQGMSGYISKPLADAEVRQVLATYLEMEHKVPETSSLFIDRYFLSDKFYGNEKFIEKILTEVEKQYPQELLVLEGAITTKDETATAAAAHKMASTVSILHPASKPMTLLQKIEAAAMSQQREWSAIESLFEQLAHLSQSLHTEINLVKRSQCELNLS